MNFPENFADMIRPDPTCIVTEGAETVFAEDGEPAVMAQYEIVKISKGEECNFNRCMFDLPIDQVISDMNELERYNFEPRVKSEILRSILPFISDRPLVIEEVNKPKAHENRLLCSSLTFKSTCQKVHQND